PGAFSSGTTTQLTNASGVATFANLVIDRTGTYSITATDAADAVNKVSQSFNITATKLLFTTQPPATVVAGVNFAASVSAVGVDNSVDPNFTGAIGLNTNTPPGGSNFVGGTQ